jgi:ketosteroid isomerase-like protein
VPQENEQALRHIARAISQKDLRKLQANSADDIEYTARFTAADGKVYRGKDGWAAYLVDLEAAWDQFQIEIEEVDSVGNYVLIASLRVTALGRGSGVPIDEKAFSVFEFVDGKAVRGSTYPHRPEALRAAGLGG